jgi:hypothetical protein
MISDIYRIEGRYPDPYQIRSYLERVKGTGEFYSALEEITQAGLQNHPLLERFFVES